MPNFQEFKKLIDKYGEVEQENPYSQKYIFIRLKNGEWRAITSVYEDGSMHSGNRLIIPSEWEDLTPHNCINDIYVPI